MMDPKPKFRLRGIDSPENPQSADDPKEQQTASGKNPTAEPGAETEDAAPSAAITLDRPLHFITAKGEDAVVQAGAYKVESVMDVNLDLIREGQASVLLQALPGTHTERISKATALLIPEGRGDLWHLVLLMPDGKRLDALGSASGVRPRGDLPISLDSRRLATALGAASISPSIPPCQPNKFPVGPRYLPIPCVLPFGGTYNGDQPSGGIPQPSASLCRWKQCPARLPQQ